MAEREWFDTDYYKVLGVTSTATDKEISRAYRKLAKAHHPDTNPGSEERFKSISVAYDVLGDAEKRKEYDEVRRLGPSAAGFGSPGSAGNFNFQTGDFSNLGDVFGGLFGGGSRRARAQRGGDLETALHLGFRDAVMGVTTTVTLPTNDVCRTCAGRGAAPGSKIETCERCGGRGVLNDDQGPFAMSSICPVCQGRGGRIITPCPNCHGTGREPSQRRVHVRIPPGVVDAQRIRLKGKGNAGVNGGPAGDLFVDVHVAKDARFDRRGRHVTTSIEVPFTAAILGTTVEVTTLDEPVTLKIAPGTQPGTTLRVRGRGVPASGKHAAGDLLVTLSVDLPKKLNKEQRGLVERLAHSLRDQKEEAS
ncbi:MAG TPA: molecular chaperone DnaJ [Acidimicrobiales bacterium]|nr:molecular chaperone DnaJ [Acidimicrobiales bacterium]